MGLYARRRMVNIVVMALSTAATALGLILFVITFIVLALARLLMSRLQQQAGS